MLGIQVFDLQLYLVGLKFIDKKLYSRLCTKFSNIWDRAGRGDICL